MGKAQRTNVLPLLVLILKWPNNDLDLSRSRSLEEKHNVRSIFQVSRMKEGNKQLKFHIFIKNKTVTLTFQGHQGH